MYINVLQLLIREIYFKILKNGQPNYKYFTEDDVKNFCNYMMYIVVVEILSISINYRY